MAYAERTKVPVGQSQREIEHTLRRYGADGFLTGWADNKAFVQFRLKTRIVKFIIAMPRPDEPRADQVERQRWRSLLLTIKAKLESVASNIEEFDTAFMAHIVLPDGQTVGEWMRPQIALAYDKGGAPKMLPDYSKGDQP